MSLSEYPEGKKNLVIKKHGQPHFVKDFGGGTTSERVMLPEADGCRVKITKFRPKAGFEVKEGIVYNCDETVIVTAGQLRLHLDDGSQVDIGPGDSYHVPAGTSYGVTALTDGEVTCVFSAAADGTLADDL